MTDPQTPEPTPAVERAERALVEAWHGTIGRAFHPTRIRETRAALAAALDVEEMARAMYEHNTAPLTARGEVVLSWDQHIASEEADGEECPYLLTAQTIRTHLLGGAA